ncbi:MAG: alpha/beta hydrolase fold domain-containing protein, partial [Pseudomonadota bacterium]
FHGGAYLVGSPRTHRALAGRIAALSGLRVALPSYPLAPENPAPAAFEAALAAWDLVVARGYASDRIVLGGDSAGGGLALALLAHLIKTGAAPAGLFAYSPWTDLTGSGGTIAANTAHDRLFDPQRLAEVIGYVTSNGAFPADDPRLSPYFADFQAPPPVWMSVARSEILLDDTLRIAGKLRAGGGVVTVAELPDAPHVWPLFDGFLPEARATISASAAFARACLSLPPMR